MKRSSQYMIDSDGTDDQVHLSKSSTRDRSAVDLDFRNRLRSL